MRASILVLGVLQSGFLLPTVAAHRQLDNLNIKNRAEGNVTFDVLDFVNPFIGTTNGGNGMSIFYR